MALLNQRYHEGLRTRRYSQALTMQQSTKFVSQYSTLRPRALMNASQRPNKFTQYRQLQRELPAELLSKKSTDTGCGNVVSLAGYSRSAKSRYFMGAFAYATFHYHSRGSRSLVLDGASTQRPTSTLGRPSSERGRPAFGGHGGV